METARREKDPEDLEEALLRLAACSFGLAQVVQKRRRLVR
jgi:hypothetical protein